MEERLIQLLKSESINPTRFAERIGVQRSSMSHILSGRNKPSFDFIVKILESFPSVNPDWLLRGKGMMYKNDIPVQPGLFDVLSAPKPLVPKSSEDIKHADFKDPDTRIFEHSANESIQNNNIEVSAELKNRKTIEKIVVFYSDKTFSDYKPTI